jgi:hypothetical protein
MPKPVNNSGGSRVPKKPSKGLTADDYIYAREVAGQPAGNRRGALNKFQAQIDKKFLEKKYPHIRKKYDITGVTVDTTYKTYDA